MWKKTANELALFGRIFGAFIAAAVVIWQFADQQGWLPVSENEMRSQLQVVTSDIQLSLGYIASDVDKNARAAERLAEVVNGWMLDDLDFLEGQDGLTREQKSEQCRLAAYFGQTREGCR